MDFSLVLFYMFGAVLLGSAVMVVVSRNAVHSALFLVLAFFNAAAVWMLLRAEFLSIALVLVYVGAVMVLFLFVVMMLDINVARMREGFWGYLPLGLIVALVFLVEMAVVVLGPQFGLDARPAPVDPADGVSNTKSLAWVLFTDYVYPFEIASFVLLVAMVAAVALTMRKRQGNKALDPASQIAIKRADRIRLVQMQPEVPVSRKAD